ncbi:hypothetical protein KKF91_20315 [Myxococcota bacterium]|nr:hypothetical protein [Myxococcota bacterium]MBU1432891.1 hypothetical protein [Myxococcota bacterium]MBU1900107.1 hypothetical protein [Myxococcota bacterium]
MLRVIWMALLLGCASGALEPTTPEACYACVSVDSSPLYAYDRADLEAYFLGTWRGEHPGEGGAGIPAFSLEIRMTPAPEFPMLYGEARPKGPDCVLDDAAYDQCEITGFPAKYEVAPQGIELTASTAFGVIEGRGLQPLDPAALARGERPREALVMTLNGAGGVSVVVVMSYEGQLYAQLNPAPVAGGPDVPAARPFERIGARE